MSAQTSGDQNGKKQEVHNHTNRLVHETSPYLLQHAHNPVEWYPWGKEALAHAREENKPIFLSIGYSACHWCHVMERESFEDEQTADIMNEHFVNIKVDREERPDLDSIYMEAVQAMTGSGGWPMSVFLTPDGRPFYGGTYYPPEPRHGMPSFPQVLEAVSEAYRERRDDIEGQAERLTEAINRSGTIRSDETDLSTSLLDEAVNQMQRHFDEHHGGFGDQPKFPQPMALDFAMTQYTRTGDLDALYMAEHTLEKMAKGGIYDHLGGGFHRYSVDRTWLVPHFEKMLYDNAQLVRTYLHIWQIVDRPLFRNVVDETIDYVLREMTSSQGGFYSTQDADTEGEEGKFFVWTPEEIEAVLGEEDAAIFKKAYGVTPTGNFEGKNILNIPRPWDRVAEQVGLTTDELQTQLAGMRERLFEARKQRIEPGRDDKILVEWNGLMIHALAEAGAALPRQDALDAASSAADFILENMSQEDGKLYRSYKDGQARFNAYVEDYASFIRALIALYEATFDRRWLAEASRLAKLMIEQFGDAERGGFYQTGRDHEKLVARRKDFVDNAVPSGNSLAAEAFIRLSKLTGNEDYRGQAAHIFALMRSALSQQPTGFGRLLCALNAYLLPSQEIAIVGRKNDEGTGSLLRVVRSRYLPNTVLAMKTPDEEEAYLPVLEDRTMVDGKPTVYVCENYACRLPVTSVEELVELLD